MLLAPDVLERVPLAVAAELLCRQRGLDRVDALDLALGVVRWLVDQIHVR